MGKFFRFIYDALSSNWLAIVLLAFLLLLTYLGTLEQVDHGLFEVQKKYFESPVLIHWLFGIFPVPLPGVYSLLVLLSVNLILGGIARVRMRWWKVGVLITHFGVVFLLVGGFISFKFSQHGQLSLLTGETSDEFVSSTSWELAVKKGGSKTEILIPEERLHDLDDGDSAVFRSKDLPFDLQLGDYLVNCEPAVSQVPVTRPGQLAEFRLRELPRDKEASANIRGVHLTVLKQDALLWGGSAVPFVFEHAGERFAVELRRVRRSLPYQIRLEEFRRELYPGTGMPKAFESDVIKIENDVSQPVKISMNEPLRHRGYTLYQSSYQEPNRRTGGRWMSTFSVARNPADDLPLIATIIISFGILVHFLIKLVRYLVAEIGGRA